MTELGSYVVTFTIYETTNYYGDSVSINVTVIKKKLEIPAEVSTKYYFNGAVQHYDVARSALYTVTSQPMFDVGSSLVTITLNDKVRYEWKDGTIDDIEYIFTINKGVAVITVDATEINVAYGDNWALPKATSNLGDVTCDLTAGVLPVGVYTATYSVIGNDDYFGATATVIVNVVKGDYDISNVKFEDKTVIYSGVAQGLFISGALPEGVTVAYENNGKVEAGIYTVTANFTGDENNYNAIPSMTATLTIKQDKVEGCVNEDSATVEAPNVIVSNAHGFAPNVEIVVTEIALSDAGAGLAMKDSEKIAASFDIALKADGVVIQPDGEITIKLLIPTEILGENFRLSHCHDGVYKKVNFEIVGRYVQFTVDELSEFVFVYTPTTDISWIVWAVIGGLALIFIITVSVCASKVNKPSKPKED